MDQIVNKIHNLRRKAVRDMMNAVESLDSSVEYKDRVLDAHYKYRRRKYILDGINELYRDIVQVLEQYKGV